MVSLSPDLHHHHAMRTLAFCMHARLHACTQAARQIKQHNSNTMPHQVAQQQ
jgi:hypothetical protein